MKLLSAEQIRQWDEYTIVNEPIQSIDLMERTAQLCAENIYKDFDKKKIKIFCAKGNNGGDGLALARIFINEATDVTVYILEFGAAGTQNFQTNLAKLHTITTHIHFIQSPAFFPEINSDDIVIDALFGSGLNRPLEGLSAALVTYINKSNTTVISIDVPSGMFINKCSTGQSIIKANSTLTFQSLKLCFLLAENEKYFGNVKVLDIGLHNDFLDTVESINETVEIDFIKSIYKNRNSFAHKGNFGHALLIAGSEGKIGASLLAARACLRAGCGLLTVASNSESTALNIYIPEAMSLSSLDIFQNISAFNAIGIGPGMEIIGDELKEILNAFKKPVVLDAGAFAALNKIKNWKKIIPAGSILTPHPKEFDRLFGECENDFERMDKALKISAENNVIIILKGHHTLIAQNGKGWFNATGNAGLAKGGSGDMLTGIITSLLAQGYNPLHAAILGVYWHGLSADAVAKTKPLEVILASDCIEAMGDALNIIKA